MGGEARRSGAARCLSSGTKTQLDPASCERFLGKRGGLWEALGSSSGLLLAGEPQSLCGEVDECYSRQPGARVTGNMT